MTGPQMNGAVQTSLKVAGSYSMAARVLCLVGLGASTLLGTYEP